MTLSLTSFLCCCGLLAQWLKERRLPSDFVDLHFFPLLLLVAVILLVLIRSPIYFCRNLLLFSSLSCSSRTASIRLKRAMRDSCNALACLQLS